MMKQYRDIGMKLTPQRLAILECLKDNVSHPSAEDIYTEVKRQYPTMSFATVYNTLEALKERGYITELSIDPRRRRYDPDMMPHHHLLCVVCGSITDVHEQFRLVLPESKRENHRILSSHVEFYGICLDCDKNNNEQKEVA